ncbi:helix-turn-helix domain [Holotrichia oblita]|uniref:Helix-turn-helix domain n=1 Tax=Holotrichia oblita TaxID=644536 RepID=A0ACB9T9Q9_HOLOL|nr:helix-turn-helix domain [Holotrichia oblita]
MMLISPIAALLLHFLLTTTVHAYSENAVYQPSRSKGERLFLNLRSGVDTERSTRRIFAQNPIRFGGRSDIPPLVGKAMEYEAMIDDELSSRERRAFNKGNHMRFGRANSNFLRFGKSRNNKNSDYNRLTRANNSLFMRFGRGRNDFLRFGRSEEFSRNKRDTSTVDDVQKRECYAGVEFELKMVLTTAEKVFLVEHYFRSYGNGRNDGPSLQQVVVRYQQQFNKAAPSKSVILAVVKKFRRTGSVLYQRKGSSGRRQTVCTNENTGRVFDELVQSPQRGLMNKLAYYNDNVMPGKDPKQGE